MTRATLRKGVRFLTSAVLVSVVLALIGLWSIIASFIPQGAPASANVIAWAEANQSWEPFVRALGLHEAFSTPIFLILVGVLALSTVLCSWQRTKVALSRTRALREAARVDARSVQERHDIAIACGDSCNPSEALEVAGTVLGGLGLRVRRSDDVLVAASPPLGIWGSPIFHWALVALMLFVLLGSFYRSEGLIGLAVGQVKPDAPESYGKLSTGPLRDWTGVTHSFRLDDFEPRFTADGIDRGPVPTVSVLDQAGNVVKTQPVYPNKMLHYGSVSVNAPAYGLSVTLSLTGADGTEFGRTIELVDFSQSAPDGTVPTRVVPLLDDSGAVSAMLHVSVVLPREGDQFVAWLPKEPSARVVMNDADGVPMLDEVVAEGGEVDLSEAVTLHVADIGWYSRLSVVDDWTRPFVYACMVVAMLALTATVLFRQYYLLAAMTDTPEGSALVVRMRLWRNTPTSRDEIVRELTQVLSSRGKEDAS